MAIPYFSYKITSPLSLEKTGKYHARVKTRGEVGLRDLAERISQISSLSIPDTVGVLEAFIQVIPEALLDGYRIKLGDFGIFTTTLSSEGAESPTSFKTSMIKKTNILFKPGKYIMKKIKNAKYEKV